MRRAALLALVLLPGIASAQSLAPMDANVATFTGVAMLRLKVGNPYQAPQSFELAAFDQEWRPVADVASRRFYVSPDDTATVTVFVPARPDEARTIRLCATSQQAGPRGFGIRGQVCGKYVITQFGS